MTANSTNPFWRAPRWLARALEDGELTPCEFVLLTYLGCAGLDYYGHATTLGQLSSVLGYSPKWISESLRRLRAKGLIEYELRERQRTPFRVTEGSVLRSGMPELWDFRTDFRTEFRSDWDDFRSDNRPRSHAESGNAHPPTAEVNAVPEKETETKASISSIDTVSPERGLQDVSDALVPSAVIAADELEELGRESRRQRRGMP